MIFKLGKPTTKCNQKENNLAGSVENLESQTAAKPFLRWIIFSFVILSKQLSQLPNGSELGQQDL